MKKFYEFLVMTSLITLIVASPAIQPVYASEGGMKQGGHGMAGGLKVKFEPATVCKKCHSEIYKEWSTSMHSKSRSAWYFSHKVASDRSGMVCSNEKGAAVKCETCHEPAGIVTFGMMMNNMKPALAATEGVTCDVCHRITDVKATGDFDFGPKKIKRGPYKDAKSKYHKTAYSPLHESSDFCKACHGQLSNLNGLVICDTLSSWKKSKYAKEGKTCQSCHMPARIGQAGKGGPKDRKIRSHVFRGPHNDPSILAEAVTLKQKVKRDGNRLLVSVSLTNSGAGHEIPTGLPERLFSIKVTAKNAAGKVIWQNWKKDIYDEDRLAAFGLFGFGPKGKKRPPMGASRLDNLLLQPMETRTLEYELKGDIAQNASLVQSSLRYQFAREDGQQYFGLWDIHAARVIHVKSVESQMR